MELGRYTHGHHESVLRSHSWRSAANSASYLLPFLKGGMNLLDVGCGPGTITTDFAHLVNPGKVIGVDTSSDVIATAINHMAKFELDNLSFFVTNLFELDTSQLKDWGVKSSFDVVHAHQVLQHLVDPIEALSKMKKLVKPGGIVAVRDSDYHGAICYPTNPLLTRWMEIYQLIARKNGGEPNAGRHLLEWALKVNFRNITPSSSTWCFATPKDRKWWGGLWADRVLYSDFKDQAIEFGVSDIDELEAISEAWKSWAKVEYGWYVVVAGELICEV